MTVWGDPPERSLGLVPRVFREYRRLRRDQSSNHAMVSRMKRRYAVQVAWNRR